MRRLSRDVRDRHVPHQEHKANPWHVRRVHLGRNRIGTACADNEGLEAPPEIEQSDQVK